MTVPSRQTAQWVTSPKVIHDSECMSVNHLVEAEQPTSGQYWSLCTFMVAAVNLSTLDAAF
jgi:hypothetical protein